MLCAYASLTLVVRTQIASALGITRDVLVTRHNPHNGLRFFYVAGRPGGASRQNHLAQGLMRKGDRNRDAPVIHGPCYVCKQCTERDAFASCFPEDFDVITGRSRVSAAEHLLVLGDLEEQTQTKKVKRDQDTAAAAASKKDDEEPPAAHPVKEEQEEPPDAPQAQPMEKEEEERPPIEISGIEVIREEGAVPALDAADAGLAPEAPPLVLTNDDEADALPAKLAPLRDMVYCQILLSGMKGKGGTAVAESRPPSPVLLQKAKDEERLPVQSPIKALAVSLVLPAEKQEQTVEEKVAIDTPLSPPPMEKKKKPRARRKNDVCADNIVPEGVRRSSRLRK